MGGPGLHQQEIEARVGSAGDKQLPEGKVGRPFSRLAGKHDDAVQTLRADDVSSVEDQGEGQGGRRPVAV